MLHPQTTRYTRKQQAHVWKHESSNENARKKKLIARKQKQIKIRKHLLTNDNHSKRKETKTRLQTKWDIRKREWDSRKQKLEHSQTTIDQP
mgnify:CR=1 FL=1